MATRKMTTATLRGYKNSWSRYRYMVVHDPEGNEFCVS